MSACLAEDELLELTRGTSLGDAPDAEAHLADCAACSALLATMLDGREPWGALAGTTLGPYRLEAQIGAGAMAAVYRARDERLRRNVAIKVHASDSPELARRLATEARAAAAVQHANIVTIHDVGTDGGLTYIALELVDGESLRSAIARGALPAATVRRYAIELARGLAAAHAQGVVHRDLKPENIVVTGDGTLKILDFGLAKLVGEVDLDATQPGTVHGTAGYMAPEQARGESADARADIFAAGAIVYELATGRRAFPGASHAERLSAVLRDTPPMEDALGDLAPIIARCLDKDPAARFQSARDLAWVLERRESAVRRRAPRLGRRAFAIGAASGVAGLIAGRWLWRRSEDPPQPEFRQLTYRLGRVMTARFTRDGARLLYGASWEGNPLAAFSMDLGDGSTQALELPSADVLAVSAHSIAIAIDRRFTRHQSATGQLAVVPLAGGVPRILLPDVQEADFAPDGETLAIVRPGGRGFRLELGGRVLVDSDGWITHPRVSPDGARVAFALHPGDDDDRGDLVVVDAGGRTRTLSSGWSSIAGIAWAGDDVWFTAAREGAAAAVRAVDDAGRVRSIAQTPGRLRLHDVTADRRAAVTVDVWRLRTLVDAGRGAIDRSLSDFSLVTDISDDGATLLLGELGDVEAALGAYLRPVDGGRPLRLGPGIPHALSPSGEHVAAVTFDGNRERFVIYSTGTANQPQMNLGTLASIGAARWIDDAHLVVRADDKLWRLAFDAPPELLSDVAGLPALDAARRRIAFVDPADDLYVVDLATRDRRRIGRFAYHVACAWRGDAIVLRTTTTPIRVVRVDADGSTTPMFEVAPPAIGLKAVDSFVLAPNGTYAYSFGQELSQVFAMTVG